MGKDREEEEGLKTNQEKQSRAAKGLGEKRWGGKPVLGSPVCLPWTLTGTFQSCEQKTRKVWPLQEQDPPAASPGWGRFQSGFPSQLLFVAAIAVGVEMSISVLQKKRLKLKLPRPSSVTRQQQGSSWVFTGSVCFLRCHSRPSGVGLPGVTERVAKQQPLTDTSFPSSILCNLIE